MLISLLILLVALQIKHFVLDFAYQPPYMWMNKGTLGHPGGIIHAGLHALMSFILVLTVSSVSVALTVLLFEFVAHYLIDYAKMNINRIKGWKCNTHSEFWILAGLDQLLHQFTYIIILMMVANN